MRHTPVTVKHKSEQHTFRVDEIDHFSHLLPEIEACEKVPCMKTLSEVLEVVSADEKKVSKEESIRNYKTVELLFPLMRRYTTTIELQIHQSGISPKLKSVMKAFFSASFTD